MKQANNEVWTVITEDRETMQSLRHHEVYTEEKAIKKAQQWVADHPDEDVYVQYYRKSDGLKVFLNMDGGYDSTGHPWT